MRGRKRVCLDGSKATNTRQTKDGSGMARVSVVGIEKRKKCDDEGLLGYPIV